MATLWNCGQLMDWLGEDLDEGEDAVQKFTPKKGEYYLFENEYQSDYEWDWQVYKDDTLMSVKNDTLRKQILCRIGSATDVNDCLILKTDYDGNVINYGDLDTLYNVTILEDKILFWYIDNSGQIITKEISNSSYTNIANGESRILPIDQCVDALLTGWGIGDAMNTAYTKHRFNKTGKKILQTTLAAGASVALGPTGGLSTTFSFMATDAALEKFNKKTRKACYGDDVIVYINNIEEIDNGVLNVNVTIANVNSIPKEIPLSDENLTNNRNFINMGLLARLDYIPYSDEYDYCSQEIPINLNGENYQTFDITLPLKGGNYQIRPFIRSSSKLIYSLWYKNTDGDRVIYGDPWSYKIQYAYISKLNPKKLTYNHINDTYTSSYSIEITINADYSEDGHVGENPIYLGFESQFTKTDSIVCNQYIKFNYVHEPQIIHGVYKTAEIVTGKMPVCVPKTVYAKDE